MGHLPRNSVAAFDIYYTINRSRWHAGRPSGLGHEWVGFLFITKREPSHAMNEFPTAPPSGGADTLDGGLCIPPRIQKKGFSENLGPRRLTFRASPSRPTSRTRPPAIRP